MDHYLSQNLEFRSHIPRHDASLEQIRAALFAFFGITDKTPTDEQIKQEVSKSSFAKSKMTMDQVWNIEKDATRRLAKRRAAEK